MLDVMRSTRYSTLIRRDERNLLHHTRRAHIGDSMTEHELWLDVAKVSRRGRWYVLPRGQLALARGCSNQFQWRCVDGVRSIRIGMLWRLDAPAMVAAQSVIEIWAKARPAQMHYSWARDVASTPEVDAAIKRLGPWWARSVYDRARLLVSTCLNRRPLEQHGG